MVSHYIKFMSLWNLLTFWSWNGLIPNMTLDSRIFRSIKVVRARHSGMWSQVGLRKHHYEQNWRWWNSRWAISNPKDDAVKVLHSICQQIWKTQQWLQDWKRSIFIPVPKQGNAKECSNFLTIALISHTNKVMLKILQASSTIHELWTSRCSSWF